MTKEIKLGMFNRKGRLFAVLAIAVIITPLVGIVLASSAMNPLVTYSGIGNPDNGTGKEGDLYVQLDNNVIWVYNNGGWQMFAIVPTVVNGTDGPIGPVGPQGPQGEQGPIGPEGPSGPQGEQGVQGIQGEVGPAGQDGTNGVDGRRGSLTFYEGIYEPSENTVLFAGDSFHYLNGDAYVYNGTEFVFFTNLVGTQGELGLQGEQGIQGIQGETGATGATGPAGPQGEQGPVGPQGATGETGPVGPAGADGVYCSDGPEASPNTTEVGVVWWIIVALAGAAGLALTISVYVARKDRLQ